MKSVIEAKDLTLETALLKAMTNKETFLLYNNSLDYSRLLPNTSLLLKDYDRYFELFPEHSSIDFGQFQTQFSQNWHATDLEILDIEYYRDYVFPAIQKYESTDIELCLLGLIKQQTIDKLSNAFTRPFSLEQLRSILDEYETKYNKITQTCDNDAFTVENVNLEILDRSNGIPYFLPSLQSSLGSMVKGQFIVVPADYGTGKTAFVISQSAHTLKHLVAEKDSRPILYFNSEGTEGDVIGRFLSNIYRNKFISGFEEIIERRDEVRKLFLSQYNLPQFLVFQINSGGLNLIKSKIEKYKPALVIIDITDVLAPEEDPQTLKKVYDQLRLLSGAYCPIIGTSQSGDTSYKDPNTGETKTRKWLGDKALYGSKTGKGGAADTIITIGKDDNNTRLRYIATPKLKRGVPVKISCEIEPIYSLYEEIVF